MFWPSIGVVIPTRRSPSSLPQMVESVRGQDYPGPVRVLIVTDRLHDDLPTPAGPGVDTMVNWRTPGYPGAHNCGVLALDTDLVAFADDATDWPPDRLRSHVAALVDAPAAEVATADHASAGPTLAQLADVLHHLARGHCGRDFGGLLARRDVLTMEPTEGGLGLVAEHAPSARHALWDLLVRAAKRAPLRFLPAAAGRPPGSVSEAAAALRWLAARHPDVAALVRPNAGVFTTVPSATDGHWPASPTTQPAAFSPVWTRREPPAQRNAGGSQVLAWPGRLLTPANRS